MTITRPPNTARYFVNIIASVAIIFAALGALVPVHADVYRWVAEDGTVNYGEREPRGREFTVISRNGTATKSGSKSAVATGKRTPNNRGQVASSPTQTEPADDQNLSAKQQEMLDRMKADEAKRQENLAEIRKSNCDSSKRLLSKMQARGRIRVRNDDGEESAMSDQARSEEIRKAQESIAVNCESLS